MAIAPQRSEIGIRRHFTTEGVHPYDEVTWERRDARITNYRDGTVAFEQLGVEVPESWSVNATNILAQKYFRGTLGTEEREWSLRQVADRVADTLTAWGIKDGYFVDDEEALVFNHELKYLIIHQKAAFNSPVWFNIGVQGVPQQGSACFILSVEDKMDSILNWYTEEGIIFKGGSGAGVNLSRIRSSHELLKGGGTASGPVSFMRGADASAGTIKSGGKTRRAAKMVILDVDHPDVEDFIWCKAIEERKARVLRDAGFDMDLDGADSHSTQYQNANNSVRVTDEFMEAVIDGRDWDLTARTDGAVIRTVPARDLFRQIAHSAWECADPGLQYDTTINRWHTAPMTGRINGSNPCSEYVHLDDSACNLASMNLLTFLDGNDEFDVEGFKAAVAVVFTGQEIIVGNADYPTERIGETTRAFRQLGIGYANLGALLMAQGLPYDSDAGRAWAAAITALLTGHAYATSARTAARMGPFAGFHENVEPMLNVLRMHQAEAARIDEDVVPPELLSAAQESWDRAVDLAEAYGVRNSQASVLAPTGTIGLLMDCDTTGVEPDLGLVKTKKLVGGGTMSIVNQTVPRALAKLGYGAEQAEDIVAYINENMSILGAPHIAPEHLPVFACSMGDNTIHYSGHIRMMGAVQPFISGAISKTVNMPEDVTVEDVEQLHIDAWRLGIKAVAIYRDNCKVAQPLSTTKKEAAAVGGDLAPAGSDAEARDRADRGPHRRARDGAAARAAAGDDVGGGRRGARAPAPQAQLEDVLVPGGRLRGLRHGRRVRGRPSGRGVHQGLQAGLDPGRDHGRLLHFDQPRAAARRAAGHLRPQVRQHEVRAGGHHGRPRAAHRHQPHRLHLPPDGARLPLGGGALGPRHPLHAGADAADAARRGGDVDPVGRPRRGRPQRRPCRCRAGGAGPGPGRAARCAPLLQLRQHHAAGGLVLRVRELRVDQRVLVEGRPRPGRAPRSCPHRWRRRPGHEEPTLTVSRLFGAWGPLGRASRANNRERPVTCTDGAGIWLTRA